MRFCDECGDPAPDRRDVPWCERHGPRWKLRRNAAAADAVIHRDERVLLARRASDPYAGCWELPGGMQDVGEHPAATARREIFEELGLEARLTGFLGFYLDPFEDGFCQTCVFLAEVDGDPSTGDGEITEWRWFGLDDLPSPEDMAWTHRQRLEDWVHTLRGGRPPALGLDHVA
jgi:ADP-ribose pyrophosphatase YjhB (NUDIX family)